MARDRRLRKLVKLSPLARKDLRCNTMFDRLFLMRERRSLQTGSKRIKKAGSTGNPTRAIMAKPSRTTTCPKKKQSRKDTCLRTVPENDYDCESQADPC